jgi:hypothetical protein
MAHGKTVALIISVADCYQLSNDGRVGHSGDCQAPRHWEEPAALQAGADVGGRWIGTPHRVLRPHFVNIDFDSLLF